MFPDLHIQCQTETCPNFKQEWFVKQEDMAVSPRLNGLVDMPDLRCRGCWCEPVRILEGKANLVK